jgi:nucleoside-diphosphate-sugar epimerase
LAKDKLISKIFWPSSIAVFGPHSPKNNTPQHTVTDPLTIYGISKLAGERWCEYYHKVYGVDVRSLRYPGLIGYKSKPGGGTTDYAVHIFNEALSRGQYECFLKEDAILPMMYMPDAINATISLMSSSSNRIQIRSSYNIAGMSFSPAEIAMEIRKHYPAFVCTYKPDFRQEIAKTWPHSIDDSAARRDWGWAPSYDLESMTTDMIHHLSEVKTNI